MLDGIDDSGMSMIDDGHEQSEYVKVMKLMFYYGCISCVLPQSILILTKVLARLYLLKNIAAITCFSHF